MWKSLKYLYFKLYKVFLGMHGKNAMPEYLAMFGVGVLLFFTLESLISIITVIYPLIDIPDVSRGKFFVYVGIPFVAILYFVFIFNGKDEKIIKEFINENEKKRKAGRRNVILFIIFTLLLFIFSLVLLVLRNEGVV